jgi:hypothetical protein
VTDTAVSLEEQAANMKAAALYYRGQVKAVFAVAREQGTPDAYRETLEAVRAWQDALEEYVSTAVSMHGALERAAADAKAVYDEAWAGQAKANADAGFRRGEEMEGPRERYARFDVKVFGQLRAWRQAEQRVSLFSEVLDDVWLRYRAVNATREDIAQILRALAFASSLEH